MEDVRQNLSELADWRGDYLFMRKGGSPLPGELPQKYPLQKLIDS
jgi:hypothetical protein